MTETCFPPSAQQPANLITGIGPLNMGFASLTWGFRAQRESWALNIGFGPLTLDFRAQRESKAILCLFSVAVCFSGRIKAEIPMPKQPPGRKQAMLFAAGLPSKVAFRHLWLALGAHRPLPPLVLSIQTLRGVPSLGVYHTLLQS